MHIGLHLQIIIYNLQFTRLYLQLTIYNLLIYNNLQKDCKFTYDKGTLHWSHTEPLMFHGETFLQIK